MSSSAANPGPCLNCDTPLTDSFCPRCGQKVQAFDPTVADFLHDFSHEMMHFDGKIFRSVGALLFKPGKLTKEYFEGRRARWVSPIRLYLVFSVAYFAFISFDNSAGDEAADARGRVMFLLVPVFAWLTSLVGAKGMNFPKHLYFSLHVHGAWFAAWLVREAGAWLLSPRFMNSTRWLGGVMLVYSAGYAILAFRKAYEEKFWKSALKMAGVLIAYGLAIMLVVLILGLLNSSS
jgi:hypothetical protein